MYIKYFKRVFDIIVSAILLIILSPMLLLISLFIFIESGSPVIFTQERIGKGEKIFKIRKFRTMTDARDACGDSLPDTERVTKIGKFLRKTSLDEIPELWCILKGEMSFVGPRPLPESYLPYFTEEEAKRHTVRPGLTGLAQINGRNLISWEEKFKYDLEYISDISFKNDMIIAWKTFIKVIKQEDIKMRTKATKESNETLTRYREVQRKELLK